MGDSVLNGYKFSINDFSDTQLSQLKHTNVMFKRGNVTFKNRLCDEIILQEKERRDFYWAVANQRSKQAITKKLHNLFVRLPFADKILTNRSYAASAEETKPVSKHKHWNPPETLHEAAMKELPYVNSILCMPIGSEKLPFTKQMKLAFLPRYYVENYSIFECTYTYNFHYLTRTTLLSSILMGGLLGMEYGIRFLTDFDKVKTNRYFTSKHDIFVERYRAFLRGFFPYTLRWTWRCYFIIGSMILISQSLMMWRKKDTMSNYVVGAAVPGALYKWKKGPKGMLISAVMFMCFCGVPIGFLSASCGLNPRTSIFDWLFVPYISSPAHFHNWSEEQKHENKQLMASLLKELKTSKGTSDTIKSPVYQSLFPSILHKNN